MNNRGFTLIEIVVAAAVIGILTASLAVPAFLKNAETVKKNICFENRRIIEHAEQRFFLDNGGHSLFLPDLVDEGYMKKETGCPSGGIYAWVPYPETSPEYQTKMSCSVHGAPEESENTLESVFAQVSSGLIDLLERFIEETGVYPKGGWKKIFEAVGLDPDDWGAGIEGVVYRLDKDSLEARPDKGYVFYIEDISGDEQKTSGIVYSLETGIWSSGGKTKQVEIETLRIEEKS